LSIPPSPTEPRLAKLEAIARDRELEIKRLRRELGRAGDEVARMERILGRITQLKSADQRIPKWVDPKRRRSEHHAIPFLVLSDLHLDEVVDPYEMDGLNAYNRVIAEARLDRVINGTVEVCRTYTAGLTFDGIVVALGGDIITGNIHEELADTNEAPVPATIVYWVPLLASALTRLADEFGKVFVPCVDGNHDRTGKRIRYKQRAENSFAWIIYHFLAELLRNDDRITFSISKAPEQVFPVYGTRFLLTHGDDPKGGGGIGGVLVPIKRWLAKKAKVRQFDIAVIGHWHQLTYAPGLFINGSLKGYDEYARGHAFEFERPQQLLFFVTPENGVTMRTSIFGDDTRGHERKLWP
jgi:predicted phosphodiesterase